MRIMGALLVVWLWAVPAQAAFSCFAHTEKGAQQPDASTVTTTAIDTTGADLIILIAGTKADNADTTMVISDSKGNTWSASPPNTYASAHARIRLHWTRPTSVGSGHTFTYDADLEIEPSLGVLACSGSTENPLEQYSGTAANSGPTLVPPSLTPLSENSLVVTGISIWQPGLPTIDGGWTLYTLAADTGDHQGLGIAFQVQTTIVIATPTWGNPSNNDVATVMAVFKNAGGLTPCTTP